MFFIVKSPKKNGITAVSLPSLAPDTLLGTGTAAAAAASGTAGCESGVWAKNVGHSSSKCPVLLGNAFKNGGDPNFCKIVFDRISRFFHVFLLSQRDGTWVF